MSRTVLHVLPAVLVLASSCGQPGRTAKLPPSAGIQIQWPPSSPADLEVELTCSRADEDEDGIPDREIPGDMPGVYVRKGKAEGLHYLEVILGEVDPDESIPLIVTLHGRGDKPRIPGGPFGNLPHPVRIIVPRGPKKSGDGFAWLPVSITSGKVDLISSSLTRVSSELARFVTRMTEMYPTEGKPIVTGFSQGAILTYALAVDHPDVVGAAFPHAGWLPPDLVPTSIEDPSLYPPIRSTHGMQDPIIRIGPTRTLVRGLLSLGLTVQLDEFEGVGHVMTPEMDAHFHAWLRAEIVDIVGPPPAPEPPEEMRNDEERPTETDADTADMTEDPGEDAPEEG